MTRSLFLFIYILLHIVHWRSSEQNRKNLVRRCQPGWTKGTTHSQYLFWYVRKFVWGIPFPALKTDDAILWFDFPDAGTEKGKWLEFLGKRETSFFFFLSLFKRGKRKMLWVSALFKGASELTLLLPILCHLVNNKGPSRIGVPPPPSSSPPSPMVRNDPPNTSPHSAHFVCSFECVCVCVWRAGNTTWHEEVWKWGEIPG